jgi:uncharacterized damage-inducible protein DinB
VTDAERASGDHARPVPGTLRPFYADWAGYQRRWVEGIRRLTPADLDLRVPADRGYQTEPWPIWAVIAHTVGPRVFWLCDVFGESGAEQTPFPGDTPGWEDDLTHPRSAEELVWAFESTWRVIEGCLDRWTPDSLQVMARREEANRPPEVHTRQSILLRLINHEAYHLGEVNLVLGSNGREPIDPFPGREWQEGSARSLREG